MKKERMKILSMVEDGKISVEEATRLLESLMTGQDYSVYDDGMDDLEDKINSFSRSVDKFAKDFGGKIDETYKGMEPKLKKATKSVVEKTARIVDDIAKSLQESLKNMDDRCDDEDDTPKEN